MNSSFSTDIQNSAILKKSSILYIECDEKLFSATNSLFEYAFNKTYSTNDSQKALEIINNHKNQVDILLIDLYIEGIDVVELIKSIREEKLDIIIIVIMPSLDDDSIDYKKRSSDLYEIMRLKIEDILQTPYLHRTTLKILAKYLIIKENERVVENQKNALKNLKYMVDNHNLLSEFDLEGNITYANDIFCEISGYTRQELIGSPHTIVKHPDTVTKYYKDIWKVISSGKVWQGKIKNKKKDGDEYWVNVIIAPIFENGKIIKYMASRQNITDHIEREKIMRSEIKRIKSENYRDREKITEEAYKEGIIKYKNEFENLKVKIGLLKKQLEKEELKNKSSITQIDKLVKSEKEAVETKDKVLSKAKKDIAELFEKNRKLEKQKEALLKKLEDSALRYNNLQESLKSV